MTTEKRDKKKEFEAAKAAKNRALKLCDEIAKVNGVGITTTEGRYAVQVNLIESLDESESLPDEIDGVPVVTRVVGKVRKQKS